MGEPLPYPNLQAYVTLCHTSHTPQQQVPWRAAAPIPPQITSWTNPAPDEAVTPRTLALISEPPALQPMLIPPELAPCPDPCRPIPALYDRIT